MIEGRDSALNKLKAALADDRQWTDILDSVDELIKIHLAVFVEPYFTFISEGKKSIETRFSKNRIAPFECIEKGDIILLKRSGAGIAGVCVVDQVWFYHLLPGSLDKIKEQFGRGICPSNSDFWDERQSASYCSLIWITSFRSFEDIPFKKSDRRGWVILK
jgi:hypothetical protein